MSSIASQDVDKSNHQAVASQVLSALNVTIPEVKIASAYRFALGALAVALLAICAAFMGLLAFMAWLVIWHTMGAVVSLSQGPYFIFHIPMALLGLLLLIFLLKPLFFCHKEKQDHILSLAKKDQPLLFEFVEKLCMVVGAPAPAIIEVDCQANASASFRRGLRGLAHRQMVLRIGLPLVAALPVRELAGVLAHELGHFKQHHGMFWSYLIRRVNFFLARIVFERDRLDERLARMRANRSGAGQAFYFLAAALIEPARGVLWLMLTIGELLTCRVLQRMEYDADSVEAQIAGARSFGRTNEIMALLSIASGQTHHDLAAAFETGRLPDNLPKMIVKRANELIPHRQEILTSLGREKTRWFDTHPCHADRIRNVERLGTTGVIQSDLPASRLFDEFGALCRAASTAYYKSVLDKGLEGVKLVSTSDIAKQQSKQRDSIRQIRRFFQDQLLATRPVFPELDARLAPADAEVAVRALAAARDEMVARAAGLGETIDLHEKGSAEIVIANAKLLIARIAPNQQTGAKIRRAAEVESTSAAAVLADARRRLEPFERAARLRLTLGLQLLSDPSFSARTGDAGKSAGDVVGWLDLCERLSPCGEALRRAREQALRAQVLYATYSSNQGFRPLEVRVLDAMAAGVTELTAARAALGDLRYPFEHATSGLTCADYLIPKWPQSNDIGEVVEAVMMAVDRFAELSVAVIAKLVAHVENVESILGLPALPEPDDKNLREQARAQFQFEQRRQERKYWFWYGLRALAGVTLLSLLVWLSIDPPSLPSMPWEDSRPANLAYRPASFSLRNAPQTVTINYRPSTPIGQPHWYQPGNPGYYQPGQPGHQAGMPSYWQSGYGNYYTPNISEPQLPQPGIPRTGIQPGRPGYQPGTPGYQPGQIPAYQPPKTYAPPRYDPPNRNRPGSPQQPGAQPDRYRPGGSPDRYQPGGNRPSNPSPGGGNRPGSPSPSPGGGGRTR